MSLDNSQPLEDVKEALFGLESHLITLLENYISARNTSMSDITDYLAEHNKGNEHFKKSIFVGSVQHAIEHYSGDDLKQEFQEIIDIKIRQRDVADQKALSNLSELTSPAKAEAFVQVREGDQLQKK